jgi:hypothetical protein
MTEKNSTPTSIGQKHRQLSARNLGLNAAG